MLHQMIDDGQPVHYEQNVTAVLGNNEECDEECEFTVKYDGYAEA